MKSIPMLFDFNTHYEACEIEQWFGTIECIGDMISLLTPREFMQMFPIRKEYDGKKYEIKDYFSSMSAIQKIGMYALIGEPSKFLFDYSNDDIDSYMVTWMEIVNRLYQAQGGKDIMLEFFEDQGTPLTTYREEDGNLVDNETGEKFKLEKPKNRLKKLFTVV